MPREASRSRLISRALTRGVIAACALTVADAPCHAQQAATPSMPTIESLQSILEGATRVLDPAGAAAEALPSGASAPAAPAELLRLPLAQIEPNSPIDVQNREGLVTLSVRNASLRQVLSALAESEGLNLIVASPADAPVTAKFQRVPLRTVIDSLLQSSGHMWIEQDGILYVTSMAAGTALAPNVQGRRVSVIELDFASAADLQPVVVGLMSPIGQSHFVETNPADNRRTKEVLVVEDLGPYVDRIEQYITEADQAPRQVLIEVRLLQVDLTDDQRSGVNWDALTRISGANLTLRSAGMASSTASPGFMIESTGGDLDTLIEALISTTDAKTLAAPRILAVNGQQSEIQIGERLGYRQTLTTETSALETVNFLDVGVVLAVTPRITRDGRVLLRIAPKVSTGAVNAETGLPDEQTTQLETDALLNSGQGMIIGGLIQERDEVSVTRVPILGTIPYLNFFFQRRSTTLQRSELVVALVPHVMPLDGEQLVRNDEEVARAFDPLTQGALCRAPRPYEPRMRDPLLERHKPILFGRKQADVCPPPGELEVGEIRRLPAIDTPSDVEPAMAVDPTPAQWLR
ncbi:MAG: type II secretion system protein GspD [Lacipirellulaceae bacterium]